MYMQALWQQATNPSSLQVTAPQLTLLENSMSKLERLNVYLLATDGGNKSGVNVFLVQLPCTAQSARPVSC